MDFDPAVFGSIASVAVFSATGDALGYANVNGQHVDAHFSSPSAGIGQLPNLPLFAVWIPLLAGAKSGASTAVTIDPSGSPWTDAQGNTYTVTVNAGAVTVGGGLSVASVTPGGGILPAGTVLQIAGTGFDSTTMVAIDGVAVASVRFINSTQMEATLGGATELTGKHFRLANATGQMVDYFPAFPSAPSTPPAGFSGSTAIHPLVPLNVFSKVILDSHSPLMPLDLSTSRHGLAMLNQTQAPVTVFRALFYGASMASTVDSFAIPPGALYLLDDVDRDVVIASAGIRMLEVIAVTSPGTSWADVYTPEVYLSLPVVQVPLSQTTVSWSWQMGTPQPAAASIDVGGNLGFTVDYPALPGLTVTPAQGTAPAKLTLKPDLALMAPGFYTIMISVSPTLPAGFPAYAKQTTGITVYLTVSAGPQILPSNYDIVFSPPSGGGLVQSTVTLTSNGQPAEFTALASTVAGTWLSVTPFSGTTPATLTVTANTAGLTGGMYSGEVAVFGPANTLRLGVYLSILPLPPPATGNLSPSPISLSFYLPGGGPAQQSIWVSPADPSIQVSVPTPASGGWLTAQLSSNTPGFVLVNASTANLAPGKYHGVVLISSTTSGSVQVPVTLTVLNTEIAPAVAPSSLALTAPAGEAVTWKLTVTSGGNSTWFVSGVSTQGRQAWLYSQPQLYVTPYNISVTAYSAQTGTYQGEVLVTWAKGVIHIPVTFTATPSAVTPPPQTTAILSAASQTPGPMAPGEIFTVFGLGIGPAPAGVQLDASGNVATTLSGMRVTVNDVAAPLVYASPGQLNAIVPYEAGTSGVARIRVTYGQASGAWDVPLAGAAPAIFTVGSTGVGQGAVLNQDSSVNGPANPAARGSVIQIFATGEGQASPAGRTGAVTGSSGGAPVLHVMVTVGGIEAPLQFAGAAPYAVTGLFQVNAVVPPGAPSGPAVPIVLTVGGAPSPSGVTIAVQ
jgi:uncharacterized protein (TIGR03437 family)